MFKFFKELIILSDQIACPAFFLFFFAKLRSSFEHNCYIYYLYERGLFNTQGLISAIQTTADQVLFGEHVKTNFNMTKPTVQWILTLQ